jgi:hypothetical protein
VLLLSLVLDVENGALFLRGHEGMASMQRITAGSRPPIGKGAKPGGYDGVFSITELSTNPGRCETRMRPVLSLSSVVDGCFEKVANSGFLAGTRAIAPEHASDALQHPPEHPEISITRNRSSLANLYSRFGDIPCFLLRVWLLGLIEPRGWRSQTFALSKSTIMMRPSYRTES